MKTKKQVKKKKKPLIQKVKKKVKKKITVTELKKKAWRLCSEYIRRKYASKRGIVKCVTCGKISHWKYMQASHLVPGRTNGILFDERGIYPACVGCNIFKSGNLHSYMRFLENKLGIDEARALRDELIANSKEPIKLTTFDLEMLIVKYKDLLDDLKKQGR